MTSSPQKDILKLIEQAEAEGWTVKRAGSGHYKAVSPSGAIVILPCSPTSGRAYYNSRAMLRRHGLSRGELKTSVTSMTGVEKKEGKK